ncbi:MAG: ACT domain-containing protein [Candidatus Thermoplasmatota archaeon]
MTTPPTSFPLTLLPGRYAVCRLRPDAPVPLWALKVNSQMSSVTRTPDELSVVCPEAAVPPFVNLAEKGWRAFKLEGPVPFTTTGVIAGLTVPLAAAGVGVFVLSTFDTDYLLVKEANLEKAQAALQAAGFTVR